MSNVQHPPLDFTKVEVLRKHMLLTIENMCTLFDVTRMSYYGWLKGRPPRKSNDAQVRRVLKQLLAVMTDHQWPMPDVIGANQKERFRLLMEILQPKTTDN